MQGRGQDQVDPQTQTAVSRAAGQLPPAAALGKRLPLGGASISGRFGAGALTPGVVGLQQCMRCRCWVVAHTLPARQRRRATSGRPRLDVIELPPETHTGSRQVPSLAVKGRCTGHPWLASPWPSAGPADNAISPMARLCSREGL